MFGKLLSYKKRRNMFGSTRCALVGFATLAFGMWSFAIPGQFPPPPSLCTRPGSRRATFYVLCTLSNSTFSFGHFCPGHLKLTFFFLLKNHAHFFVLRCILFYHPTSIGIARGTHPHTHTHTHSRW